MDLHSVKISGQYHKDFKISVDGHELPNVTDVQIQLGYPHEVTITMLADVDIETEAVIFAVLGGKKYKVMSGD